MTRAIAAQAFLALALGSLMAACNHPAGPEELAAVDRMAQHTDSMTARLNAMDTAALKHFGALFEAERPGILQRFRDTLQPHEAELLGNYHRTMSVQLPLLMAARSAELDRLDSAARRLQKLRHDMEQGLMPQRDRQAALAMEKRWSAALETELDSLAAQVRNMIRDRQLYRADLDSLLRQ